MSAYSSWFPRQSQAWVGSPSAPSSGGSSRSQTLPNASRRRSAAPRSSPRAADADRLDAPVSHVGRQAKRDAPHLHHPLDGSGAVFRGREGDVWAPAAEPREAPVGLLAERQRHAAVGVDEVHRDAVEPEMAVPPCCVTRSRSSTRSRRAASR